MTSRECVVAALRFQPVDRVPTDGNGEESDVCSSGKVRWGRGRESGQRGKIGKAADQWGCVFEAAEDGVAGEVKEPLIAEWSQLDGLEPPWEVLEQADFSEVNTTCAASTKFVMEAWCDIQPFQRMQYLRGTENLFIDIALEEPALHRLGKMVHEFYLKKVEMLCQTDLDGIHLEDDWGSQNSLLISPKFWRQFFKPMYQDYCELAHRHGKFLIMHSDGYIDPIISDLIEIGVDGLNAQLDCLDVPAIAERFHGKICFWGGFDRQRLLPWGTEAEIRSEVRRIASCFFKYGRTGVVGQCFQDKGVSSQAIAWVYDEWLKQ
jgi:hypothetical protein